MTINQEMIIGVVLIFTAIVMACGSAVVGIHARTLACGILAVLTGLFGGSAVAMLGLHLVGAF